MFPSSGIQALRSYSSEARTGEILTAKRRIPNQPRLTGVDNIDISGRSKAIAVAKSFTARLNQATQAAEPAVSQAIGSNTVTAAHIQEAIQIKKHEREEQRSHDLPKEAVLGFSTMTEASLEEATKVIEKAKEPPPDKYHTRINIDSFSMKFIRALNPIPI